MNHERAIDGLRGIAILSVILFHAFPGAVSGGYVGVDIFFVLSGFLITRKIVHEMDGGRFSVLDFFLNRVRRLVPAMVPVLIATLSASWWLEPSWKLTEVGRQTAWAALFSANVGYWLESGYFDQDALRKPLLHLWSLGIEAQFYLTIPIVLLLGRRSRYLSGLSVVAVLSFLLGAYMQGRDSPAAFFLPQARVWELYLGGCLACAPGLNRSPNSRRWFPWIVVLALAGLVLAVLTFSASTFHPGPATLIPVGATASLLWWGARGDRSSAFLTHWVLGGLGRISYSLYLWHWPILVLGRLWVPDWPSAAWSASLIALSILVSAVSYRCCEQPFMTGGSLARKPGVPLLLLLALFLAGLAGLVIAQGWASPFRRDADMRRIEEFRYLHEHPYRSGLCFIEKIEQIDRARSFSSACVDPPAAGTDPGPLLLLWGDSMTAHLYPGLRQMTAMRPELRLGQFTIASCPPVLGYRKLPLCAELNQSTIRRIAEARPTWVLLSALDWGPDDAEELRKTVAVLSEQVGARVLMVGRPPVWNMRLPQIVFSQAVKHGPNRVPVHVAEELNPDTWKREAEIKALAAAVGVKYFSLVQILCPDGRACRIRADDGPDRMMAWDALHFTDVGSELVARRLLGALP